MRDISQVYSRMVVELIFPKEQTISAIVCSASAIEILTCLYRSLQTPCNPYAEVVRGLVTLETEERPRHARAARDELGLRFLEIDYVKRRVKFGIGPEFLDFKCWSFKGILNEIARS